MAASLSQLRERAKVPANMQDSPFLAPSEWNDIINDAYRALWDDVVSVNVQFRVTPSDFSITSTASPSVALPAGFRAVVNVIFNPGTEGEQVLNAYGIRRGKSHWERSYRLEGANLVIEPRGRAVGNYRLNYTPNVTPLAADGDTVDAELDQFDRYLVLHAGMSALAIEESDFSQVFALWQIEQGKVQRWAAAQRRADADSVEDVRGRRSNFLGDPWV